MSDSKEQNSVFKTLSEVPVDNKVRQKGNFWYVSWSNAVRELLKRYPNANWEFTQYNGVPYLKTDAGCFVECAVTVEGITRKQMMPILNFKNQVEDNPDAAQVNKSQMRALTKAIALHGFGLDLWAGEDLDDANYQEQAAESCYPDDRFEKSFPIWEEQILSGKKTPDELIAFLSKKGVNLSDEQTSKIKQTEVK